MRRAVPLVLALVALAGCQRSKPDALPADAAAEAQARTSAKALADISAAEDASRTPLPAAERAADAPSPKRRTDARSDEPALPDELPENGIER
ncbi:hypothetical protein Q4F19_01710 [Sphingomonas sp. BIUV-7]|uniref:Argininosuccinate lyase n=1 Tax=Sphingomonas natans TaxID=3063330 RepID=A0ABT8Y442_9SPHN|nr:hypothetical protein [Sphingomonas sp. BIUV-7]MDO6413087.1 hypothetical protein [Sphingomonas sp. BIUV-7]